MGPTWPPVHRLLGGNSAVVKWLERAYDHSCLHSFEVMNAWSYPSTDSSAFLAWCCTENGASFTSYYCNVIISVGSVDVPAVDVNPLDKFQRPHCCTYGERRGVYTVSVGKSEGKIRLGRLRYRWKSDIKMDLQ